MNEEFCRLLLMDGSAGSESVFDLRKSSVQRKEVKADVSDDISLLVLTLDLQVKLDKDQDFQLQGSRKFPPTQSARVLPIIGFTLSSKHLTSVFRSNRFIDGNFVSTGH